LGAYLARWRIRAIREVRDQLDRFLNFPLNQKISLGDYGTYDGKNCRFEWLGNVAEFGVQPKSVGMQHEIAETYATSGKVDIQGKLNFAGDRPCVDVSFKRASALAFRGCKIGFDQVQLVNAGKALTKAIEDGLEWNRDWVVITQLWQADGFTHLVSGSNGSCVQIEARANSAPELFNYADPSLGLEVTSEKSMSYCAVGLSDVLPYFAIHKLRQSPNGQWSLYKYGLS